MNKTIVLSILCLNMTTGFAQSPTSSFSSEQQTEIKGLVKEYLLENPEILVEVSQELRRKMQEQRFEIEMEYIGNKNHDGGTASLQQSQPLLARVAKMFVDMTRR